MTSLFYSQTPKRKTRISRYWGEWCSPCSQRCVRISIHCHWSGANVESSDSTGFPTEPHLFLQRFTPHSNRWYNKVLEKKHQAQGVSHIPRNESLRVQYDSGSLSATAIRQFLRTWCRLTYIVKGWRGFSQAQLTKYATSKTHVNTRGFWRKTASNDGSYIYIVERH